MVPKFRRKECMQCLGSLRFKFNISQILVAVKKLYSTRFKEAYTHKQWRNKEEEEGVYERNLKETDFNCAAQA